MKLGRSDQFLYLIASVKAGIITAPVKIGITTDLVKRVQSLQTACPYKIILHEYWESKELSPILEILTHDALRQERMSGEWFDADPEIARVWIECVILLHLAEWGKKDREFQLKVYQQPCFGARQLKGELRDWREIQKEIIGAEDLFRGAL